MPTIWTVIQRIRWQVRLCLNSASPHFNAKHSSTTSPKAALGRDRRKLLAASQAQSRSIVSDILLPTEERQTRVEGVKAADVERKRCGTSGGPGDWSRIVSGRKLRHRLIRIPLPLRMFR